MGEGECIEGRPKKSRQRKKYFYSQILKQMEFYFSDSNLTKDRFLTQLLNEDPHVDLEIFLKFNKLRKLNCTVEDIRKALKSSELIDITEDGLKLFRKTPLIVKEDIEECTIYVENIKLDTTHESLSKIFSYFGKVNYVSIPKYKHNKKNKGFAFIEFESTEQAKDALTFFYSIDCKLSPESINPEELQSIVTFEENSVQESNKLEETDGNNKRKRSEEEELEDNKNNVKKIKTEDEIIDEDPEEKKVEIDNNDAVEIIEEDSEKTKKKKKNKKEKFKKMIKEMGLQILSKKEWKKLRNTYLDLQRKKMKEFKHYLNKQKKYSQNTENNVKAEIIQKNENENANNDFVPGLIVKMQLLEPCSDVKKLKNEVKIISPEVQYVDIPLPAGSDEVFLRFNTAKAATEFSILHSHYGKKLILEGDEETQYWDKIEQDRKAKFAKSVKKQRGRDKLLKKAEKEAAKHMRFVEENEPNNIV